MKKRILTFILAVALSAGLFAGCGAADTTASDTQEEAAIEETTEVAEETIESNIGLEDGEYVVDFETDSTMFHINEAYDGKATMTVKDGQATVHIVLASTHILNLYVGLAEDAQKEGAVLLEPTVEEVAYSDGTTDEANAFDLPVPVIDEEFDVALIGTKGTWYDHKVKVTNVTPASEAETETTDAETEETVAGETINVTLDGGSGKASIESPAPIEKTDDGYVLTVKWSSEYYDYMIVDGTKYLPINTEGNSVFEIPVSDITTPLSVIADTVAMSQPHEIEYTITFN